MHGVTRCPWAGNDPVYQRYHDQEWGVPVHDDRKLFEMLILEGFQAGLSWITILKRRNNFRKAFAKWDWKKIAAFDGRDRRRLLNDTGIIRNRLKIDAAIENAAAFEKVRVEQGSFDTFIWKFTGNTTLRPPSPWKKSSEIPTHTLESDAMSKELRNRGFRFVGTVICYSFMQAVGMVDDHVERCFKCVRK